MGAQERDWDEVLNADHLADAAMGTARRVGSRRGGLVTGDLGRVGEAGLGRREKLTAERQQSFLVATRQQSIMANPSEARRQDMVQKTANEFVGLERHAVCFPMILVSVILPVEGDGVVVDRA